jgi:hypothetical protein
LSPLNSPIKHIPRARNINHLPTGSHTTTLGLKKVWWVIWKGQEDAVYGDEQLLVGTPQDKDVIE